MEFEEWWEQNKERFLKLAKTNLMDFYTSQALQAAAEEAWNFHVREDANSDNKCPKCGCELSFGISDSDWICTECGLMSRDYYYGDTRKGE